MPGMRRRGATTKQVPISYGLCFLVVLGIAKGASEDGKLGLGTVVRPPPCWVDSESERLLSKFTPSAATTRVEMMTRDALARKDQTPPAIEELWFHLGRRALPRQFLSYMLHSLLLTLVPSGARYGVTAWHLESLVAAFMLARSLLTLQEALGKPKPPKWTIKIRCLLQPGWAEKIKCLDTGFLELMKLVLSGAVSGMQACVYALFNQDTLYIGKAALERAMGRPGACARLVEHLRGVLCPHTRDAKKVRYSLLAAAGFMSIMWLPCALFRSPAEALAGEGVAIKCLAPNANAIEQLVEYRKRGLALPTRAKGDRNRPPSWVRRAQDGARQGQSIWALDSCRGQLLVETQEPLPLTPFTSQLPFKPLYPRIQLFARSWAFGHLGSGPAGAPFGLLGIEPPMDIISARLDARPNCDISVCVGRFFPAN